MYELLSTNKNIIEVISMGFFKNITITKIFILIEHFPKRKKTHRLTMKNTPVNTRLIDHLHG